MQEKKFNDLKFPTGDHEKFKFVCIDTETTGLDPKEVEVIEVCAIEYNLDGDTGEMFKTFCRPTSSIPSGATRVNGITDKMVKDSPNYLTDGIREALANFIGLRTCDGHNFIRYDRLVIRIKPKSCVDTMLDYEKNHPRKRKNLKACCNNLGLGWDDEMAHRAEYDVMQTIKLRIKMHQDNMVKKNAAANTPLFDKKIEVESIDNGISITEVISEIVTKNKGVSITDFDAAAVATQAYSFSRINTFMQCPFKWYMEYVKGFRQSNKSYFVIGHICHTVAEWSGKWCYKRQFALKFDMFFHKHGIKVSEEYTNKIMSAYGIEKEDVTAIRFGEYLYDNRKEVPLAFKKLASFTDLVISIDKQVSDSDFEHPNKPDEEVYERFISAAIVQEKCTDVKIINDVNWILYKFYNWKDYTNSVGDLMMMEKKLAFDKNWKPVDFYSNEVYMRGIIDTLRYCPDEGLVIITDYKSSRKMMKESELRNDPQLKVYVMLVCRLMEQDSFNRIIIRIDYMRFCQTIEHEITNPYEVAAEAEKWIDDSVKIIESELTKAPGKAFEPCRNEHCHTCDFGGDGRCPLFNKDMINNIGDPFNFMIRSVEDCVDAWKRVEANKAESNRLTSMCKDFTQEVQTPVFVDEKAKLSNYPYNEKKIEVRLLTELLISKGYDLSQIIEYFSVSKTSLQKMIKKLDIDITEEEMEDVSYNKLKHTFKALTNEEVDNGGYMGG